MGSSIFAAMSWHKLSITKRVLFPSMPSTKRTKRGYSFHENDKLVRMITGKTLKKKVMFRDKTGKWVRTYTDVVSSGKLIKDRGR